MFRNLEQGIIDFLNQFSNRKNYGQKNEQLEKITVAETFALDLGHY